MSISLIAAVAKNNVIGKNNALPWHIPEDLKHFKQITKGKIVLMGQKTFESVGLRPFPNRTNIVISNMPRYQVPENVILYNDLQKALNDYKNQELFIIGGASIYKQTIDLADKLYITHVDQEVEGDAFFPEINPEIWQRTENEKHQGFRFNVYKRKPTNF